MAARTTRIPVPFKISDVSQFFIECFCALKIHRGNGTHRTLARAPIIMDGFHQLMPQTIFTMIGMYPQLVCINTAENDTPVAACYDYSV
jgi:hypothetical protein